MSDSIPTAAEALAITEGEITKQSSILLDRIVDKIHEAATNMKTDSRLDVQGKERNAVEHVVGILRSTGYEVKVEDVNDQREGEFTIVHFSWARAKK